MEKVNDLYCKIYVNTDISRQALTELISQALSGTIERYTVAVDHCEIDVRDNKEYDEKQSKEPDAGFLYFRYYLDVNPLEGQTRVKQIALVAKLLERLWSQHFPAVAASDYEDELPRNQYTMSSPGK